MTRAIALGALFGVLVMMPKIARVAHQMASAQPVVVVTVIPSRTPDPMPTDHLIKDFVADNMWGESRVVFHFDVNPVVLTVTLFNADGSVKREITEQSSKEEYELWRRRFTQYILKRSEEPRPTAPMDQRLRVVFLPGDLHGLPGIF